MKESPAVNPPFGRLGFVATEQRTHFLVLALPTAEMRRACRELGLDFPGYRIEKLPAARMAVALATEYERDTVAARLVDHFLDANCDLSFFLPRGALDRPMIDLLTHVALSPPAAAVPSLLWRFFSHPSVKVRSAAVAALSGALNVILGGGPADVTDAATTAEEDASLPKSARDLRALLRDKQARVARLDKDLAQAQQQLVEERRQAAAKDTRIAALKEELAAVERRLAEADAARLALEAGRDRDAAAEARRTGVENVRIGKRLAAAEMELAGARAREADLLTRLKATTLEATASSGVRSDAATTHDDAPAGGPAGTFQLPVLSREFYDSIERCDPRLLRTAFEKIVLLAQNIAHPGIDAKPMEGADGLYRIKVAQDVRLFYRRLPGNRLGILSLVDRDDLDRYIRQYRARPEPRGHA